jgi:hypothetical protein
MGHVKMAGPGFVNDVISMMTRFCSKKHVSSDSRKWLIQHLFSPSSCKKQINKQNSYLLLAFLQSGSVPELDMPESKHLLPGQFVHSEMYKKSHIQS